MKKLFLGLFSIMSALGGQVAFADYGSAHLAEYAQLRDCQGTLRVTLTGNGEREQIQFEFKDVVSCMRFEVYSSDGRKVLRKGEALKGRLNAMGGTFTLDRKDVQDGTDSIVVWVRSPTREISDQIRVELIPHSAVRRAPWNNEIYR